MRSIVPTLEKPRFSARRAHSTTSWPLVPGMVAGRPIPISMKFAPRWTRKLAPVALERLPGWAHEMLRAEPVARLGLLDDRDRPRVLPVTFALVDGEIYSAIDNKPKASREPARLRYLCRRPQAALTVDRYSDDW